LMGMPLIRAYLYIYVNKLGLNINVLYESWTVANELRSSPAKTGKPLSSCQSGL
jgi:hypothetical protein